MPAIFLGAHFIIWIHLPIRNIKSLTRKWSNRRTIRDRSFQLTHLITFKYCKTTKWPWSHRKIWSWELRFYSKMNPEWLGYNVCIGSIQGHIREFTLGGESFFEIESHTFHGFLNACGATFKHRPDTMNFCDVWSFSDSVMSLETPWYHRIWKECCITSVNQYELYWILIELKLRKVTQTFIIDLKSNVHLYVVNERATTYATKTICKAWLYPQIYQYWYLR